ASAAAAAPVAVEKKAPASDAKKDAAVPAEPLTEGEALPAPDTKKDAAAAGEPAVEGGTPKLVVPEKIFNFGTMRDTETVSHKFVLRNEGTGTLKITNVRASCGCTTTELEKDVLAPGEEVKISASTNLSGRQGKQVKAVTVTCNDPDNPTVQLRMEGMVTASINVEPSRINFGEILDNEPRESIVTITSTVDDLTFAVKSAELTGMDYVQHEIKEIEAGKSYQLIIKTVGDLPVGQHNGRMIIRTDTKVRPIIFFNISMQVIGPLKIMPPSIHIRHTGTEGEVTSQQLRISPGRIKEFEVTEVICPVEGMEATITPQGNSIYLLRLENMPNSDILQGKSVILRTNLEDYKEVLIPFKISKLRTPRRPPGSGNKKNPPLKTIELTPEQQKAIREHTPRVPAKKVETAPVEKIEAAPAKEGEAAPTK
ncbi:MAG: DUF1573 domain-containing protein, partial [Candidatus Hydrogenedentes bacterium]|nr:DUF1573 domain-containing protein [Candidatus Hydrogenedentota bacterium]